MFFNAHNHTMYSNLRLLDCIIKPTDLIDKAIQLGLSGIAITDHEALCSHMEVNAYAEKIRENNPDFTIALGNEIYLTDSRDKGQLYYHFILIAKDAWGHRGLRELSSTAWYNSYYDRGMERVPLLKSELFSIMPKYKGHIMATTACLGGELSKLGLSKKKMSDTFEIDKKIDDFINFCINVFGKDNFFIECAPSTDKDQIYANLFLENIANEYELRMIAATDSHYLTPETRFAHKAYLNSKGGEREVDSFYEFARLMDETETRALLQDSFSDSTIDWIFKNTEYMRQQIQWYSLEKPQQIPLAPIVDYPKNNNYQIYHQTLRALLNSDNIQERCWINDCLIALQEKNLLNNTQYLDRLEIEADVISFIGSKLGTCLFAYFNTFKHYIDLFWECGSIVGPGRGSATGFLSNYLLGITQLDPIRWNLPYWRFLNKERAELPSLMLILGSCKKRTLTIA